jgi:hypothetical protein
VIAVIIAVGVGVLCIGAAIVGRALSAEQHKIPGMFDSDG